MTQSIDDHACPGLDKKCKVQTEMNKMWETIRNETISQLRTHTHTKRLIITGISLGGALTCLAAVDIKHFLGDEFPFIEPITFGSPRVGNKNWAAWFNTVFQEMRIHLKDDPISVLPYCLTLICNYGYTGARYECVLKDELCRSDRCRESKSTSNYDLVESVSSLTHEVVEHWDELKQGELKGIINHIYDYPKIHDHDFCH